MNKLISLFAALVVTVSTFAQSLQKTTRIKPDYAIDATDFVKRGYPLLIIKYNSRLNQLREDNAIHIFIDEKGNFIKSSLPTTAREDNIYIFHVIYEYHQDKTFKLKYEGEYDPVFQVIAGGEDAAAERLEKNSNQDNKKKVFAEQVFGAIGPFTSSFTIAITNKSGTYLLNKTCKVAELHHITLHAGLYSTFLRDPQNINTFIMPNGDSTLVADDPTQRGIVTVMLSFYPWPRNVLYPYNSWKERLGICVGGGISKNIGENFFFGGSYDLARGMGITGGIHYGRRNEVINYPNFDFGNQKYSGTLTNRVIKRWDLSFFVGVNIDFRLLGYISNATTL